MCNASSCKTRHCSVGYRKCIRRHAEETGCYAAVLLNVVAARGGTHREDTTPAILITLRSWSTYNFAEVS